MPARCSRRDALRAVAVAVGGGLGGCMTGLSGGDKSTVSPAPVPTLSPTRTTPTRPPTETPDGGRFERAGDCDGSTSVPGRESARWPMAGHDAGAGGYNASATLPERRPDTEWSVDLGPNEVYPTTPIIGTDVYLGRTVYDGGSHTGTTVLALDRRSGEEQWQVGLAFEHVAPPAFDPATETVYVLAGQDHDRAGPGQGEVLALAASTGEERWRFTVPRELTGAPVLAGGLVLVTNTTFDSTAVHALDGETGEEVWRFDTGPEVPQPPTVSDGIVYVSRNRRELCALDVGDGSEQWCRAAQYVATRPVVGSDALYLGDPLVLETYCAASGDLAWRWVVSEPSTAAEDRRGIIADPVAAGDRLYVTTADTSPFQVGGNAWLYALDPAGDGRAWRTNLGQGGGVVGLADGVLAQRASGGDRELVAFRPDGTTAWRLPGVGAPLAASADRLLAVGGSTLQAFAMG